MNPSSARARASALFHHVFGAAPTVIASAPGRINLIGEHLDYNGGPVLPFAIERRTWVAASRADEFFLTSSRTNAAPVRRVAGPVTGDWTDYIIGVAHELRRDGEAVEGAHVAVVSDVEPGAGLSSSAALTVATAAAFERLAGNAPSGERLADIAFRAEHDYVGVRCGRMDQTIVTHAIDGHAILFDTASGERSTTPFPYEVWVIPTGVSHALADGGFNARRRECEEALQRCRTRWAGLPYLAAIDPSRLPEALALLPDPLDRRVRHVVTEVSRTRRAQQALEQGDLPGLGRVLAAGHASLQHDFESSIEEADALVDFALAAGAYGARLTGAGWGGSVIVIGRDHDAEQMVDTACAAFAQRFGRKPEAWRTRASFGVRVNFAA